MNAKQILLLAFIGGAIGAALGFLGTQSVQKKVTGAAQISSPFSPVSELSDVDFLEKYMEEKKVLSANEQALGDRLYACLVNKELVRKDKSSNSEPQINEDDETNEKKQSSQKLAGGVSGERKKATEPVQRAPRPILAVAAKNAEIQQQANQRYLGVFPAMAFKHAQEDNFGVKTNLVGKIQDFLKDNVCQPPNLSMITEDQRSRSRFFDGIKDSVFRGSLEVFGETAKDNQKLNAVMQFKGSESFITVRSDQALRERRTINPEIANAAWRYNACGLSVVLVGEQCPWNKKFENEYKDFYYTPDSRKLIGNIYCKNPSDTKWTNVGNIILGQSSE